MYSKTEYKLHWFLRLIFISLGLLFFIIGFIVDGIRIIGNITNKGSFQPIKVGIYETIMDKNYRYRWKVKYEFFIDEKKYVGSKFFRGGPDKIDFKKEIGYLPFSPKINWLETDEPKGINLILCFIIGQFFIWFALRKRLVYAHDLSVVVNGVYFSNTGLLPVKGLGPLGFLRFIVDAIKIGFKRVFSFRILLLLLYLSSVWLIILWAKNNSYYASFAVILSVLTYAQAGVHGTFINIIGGIIGKIFFISFLLYPPIESKYETNYLVGSPVRTLSLYGLISSFGAFIFGIGFSLILFNFMSSGLCREDSIIGLVMFLFCYKAHKNMNNPIVGFINSFEKGNPQNANAARLLILGGALGFLIGFVTIWTPYVFFIDYLVSSIVTGLGLSILLISFLFRKNINSETVI